MQLSVIALSGGFDPLQVGHLEMIRKASDYGIVVIILNSDEWLLRKKGYVFMPWNDRRKILESIEEVDMVIAVNDDDGSVCEALEMLRPDYFGNGGDRKQFNTPEDNLCKRLGIETIYGLGDKIRSSSDLVKSAASKIKLQDKS